MAADTLPTRRGLYRLHRWAALGLGYLALVVFFSGTVAVFSDALDAWADRGGAEVDLAELAASGRLDALVADATARVDPGRAGSLTVETWGRSRMRLRVYDADDTLRLSQLVDAAGVVLGTRVGDPAEAHSSPNALAIGRFLRDLHVDLLLPSALGLFVTGIVGAALLLLLVTGAMVAWPRRRRLLSGLRTRSLRVWLGDGHGALGLLSAPFLFVVTWSGVVLSLSFALLALALGLVASVDEASITAELRPQVTVRPGAAVAPLGPLVVDAQRRSATSVGSLSQRRGDEGGAELFVHTARPGWRLSTQTYLYDAHRGALRWQGRDVGVGHEESAGSALIALTHALHEGNLAGVPTRWAWFVFGLLTSGLFASGAAIWALRREGQRRAPGAAITGTLGLPFALLLVPLAWALAAGLGWTPGPTLAAAFVGGALLSAGLGLRLPLARALRVLFALTGVAALAIPPAGYLATGLGSWHLGAAFGVDLVLVALAVGFLALTLRPPRLPAMAREVEAT
ncbi:MAG: PepSY-associated TM helix domain-containing protein [Myxococcota bacterium]